MPSVTKYIDCFKKAGAAIPRDVKQTLLSQIKEREASGMEPNKAAKQVATEMRDRARADQASVMEGIKAAKVKPAAAPVSQAAAPATPAPVSEKQQITQEIVAAHQQAMPNGPKVHVLDREQAAQHLEGQRDARAASVRDGTIEGFYDPATDSAVIVPESLRIREGETVNGAVGRVIAHETAGHGGWARLFKGGPLEPEFRGVMDAFWQHEAGQDFSADFQRTHGYGNLDELATRYGYDNSTPEGRSDTLQEHFARLAEDPAPPKWFDAVITRFTDFFRKLGFNAWTDSDTRILLQKGRDAMGMERSDAVKRADEIRFSKVLDDISGDAEKERGYVTSVKNAKDVAPSVKEKVHGVYTPITNAGTKAEAKEWINRVGWESAQESLMANKNPTARDIAAGQEVAMYLQGVGRDEEAGALWSEMAAGLTTHAQAVQHASTLEKYTEPAIRAYVDKQVGEMVEKNPAAHRVWSQLTRLKKLLGGENITQAAGAAIMRSKAKGSSDTVQKRINQQMVDNPKSVWGQYKEVAVNALANKLLGPRQSGDRPALDVFTKHLTAALKEKIPQGELAEARKKAPTDEAALIAEAINNKEKYQEVWNEAQKHVQEMFKDNPEALQSLDSYFGQILEKPFSEKSLKGAVSQAQTDLNIKMRDILRATAKTKEQVRKELTDEVIKRTGLSEEKARSVAESVHQEFERQLQGQRDIMLKQLMRTPTARLPKSEIQKLMELNNAGTLDNPKFFAALSKKFGIPAWTPELGTMIKRLQKEHERALESGNTDIAMVRAAEMMDAVHSVLPKDAWARTRAVQNMSLLMNPKTIIRNIGGNSILFAADQAADTISWGIDKGVAIAFRDRTNQYRTRASADVGERWSGLLQPARDWWNGYQFAREGGADKAVSFAEGTKTMIKLANLTSRGVLETSDVHRGMADVFSSRTMNFMHSGLAMSLSIPDRAFFVAARNGDLARQMHLHYLKTGEKLLAPTQEMFAEAEIAANRAIFQDPNKISTLFNDFRVMLNKLTGSKEFGVGTGTLPFAQVPGSIVLRSIEMTPAGLFKAIHHIYKMGHPTDRTRAFHKQNAIDAISRVIVGTGGASVFGLVLAKLGIMSGVGPENKDLAAFQRDSGWGKYMINLSEIQRRLISGNFLAPGEHQDGDVLMNYDWAQPLAANVAMGASYAEKQKERAQKERLGIAPKGALEKLTARAGGAGQILEAGWDTIRSQPLLTGLMRLVNISAGGDNDIFTTTAISGGMNVAGMMVPTLAKQINNYFDNTVPETGAGTWIEQTGNRIVASIPGMQNFYPPKYDVFGEANKRYNYGGNSFLNVFLNPATLRQLNASPEVKEMQRLYDITGRTDILPKKVDRSVTVPGTGKRVELDNQQLADYQMVSGQLTMQVAKALLAMPKYAEANADVKASLLAKSIELVHKMSVMVVTGDNPELSRQAIDALAQDLTNKVQFRSVK